MNLLTDEQKLKIRKAVRKCVQGELTSGWGEPLKDIDQYAPGTLMEHPDFWGYADEYLNELSKELRKRDD